MSSNKLIYDSCAYSLRVNDNKDQFKYHVYVPKFENCSKCKFGNESDRQRLGDRVDLESELRDQNRLSSLCPSKKYLPCGMGGNADSCKTYPTVTPYLCERDMVNWDKHIPNNRLYDVTYKADNDTCSMRK
jgi:hypothetical protein